MRQLIVMRHAKAERSAPSGRDRDRGLTARGRSDAALMGRVLAERDARPTLVLVSDSTRTRQTWDAAREPFGEVSVRVEAALYDAPVETLRRLVERLEDEVDSLMIVAHNPGVHHLAHTLLVESAASPALLDRLAGGFPTGAAAVFAVDAAGRAAYDGFLTPKAFGGGAEE